MNILVVGPFLLFSVYSPKNEFDPFREIFRINCNTDFLYLFDQIKRKARKQYEETKRLKILSNKKNLHKL